MTKLRVLIACERSGQMRRAFRALGHDSWSADMAPADDGSPHHFTGDAREHLGDGWDLLIAHPPCTYLANSGVRWLHSDPSRWDDMRAGAALFLDFLNAPIRFRAVENPVMHGYAREIIGRGPDFTVQPWQFGDNVKKRTGWWTVNLPRLKPTSDLDGSTAEAKCHREPPGPDRARKRSESHPGMCAAIARQWGAAVIALTMASAAAADVVDEPGGSILCDYRPAEWWALQPSIVGGPMQPASAWLPTNEPGREFGVPAGWGAVWVGLPGRSGQPTQPVGVAPESPAPVPIGGIGALFAGLLAGIAIAWRLRR